MSAPPAGLRYADAFDFSLDTLIVGLQQLGMTGMPSRFAGFASHNMADFHVPFSHLRSSETILS